MTVFLIFVIFHVLTIGTTVLGCDPLIYRGGVKVKCMNPQTKTSVDCYSRQTPIPVGTIAKYNCESPFYLPTNSELTDRERTLTCNTRGKWAGGLPKFHLYSCTLNCGVTDVGSFASFVAGGIVSKQTDWPWHATIFLRPRSDREFSYQCGGSLIKPYGAKGFLILTAAHCVATALNTARSVNDVLVALGSEESSLAGFEDHSPDGKLYKVKEIVVHKSYGGPRSDFQSDIALLRLTEPVAVKPNILPVCLSKSAALPDVGEVGHIVGFGLYQKETSAASIQLRRASFSVVSPDKCFEWRSRKLLPQEYCAGTDGLQNACNGDSGGGMVFNGTDDQGRRRFYLQGLVSHGRVNVDDDAGASGIGCDTFSVYTKVSRYVDWIYTTAERLFEEEEDEVAVPPAFVPTTEPVTEATTTTTTRRPTRPPTTSSTRPPPSSFPESPNSNPDVELIDVSQESGSDANANANAKDYELAGLERHNHYRRLHSVAPLRLSATLNAHAQANAEKQIREGTFTNSYEHGVNKNIYKFTGPPKSGPEAVRVAVDKWYDDIAKYNWARPSYTTFSQVVWKNTLEMGVGFATSKPGGSGSGFGARAVDQIVIVSYSPPGNVQGQFQDNVFPKRGKRTISS